MTISRNQAAYDAYERAIRAGKGHLTALDEAIAAVTDQQSSEPDQKAGEEGDHG